MQSISFFALALAVLFIGSWEGDAQGPFPLAFGKRGMDKGFLASPRTLWEISFAAGPKPRSEDPPARNQGVYATCAAFSPDNKFVLVGFSGGSHKKQPKRTALADSALLWEVANGKEVLSLKGHPGGVTFVGFLPDGDRAITVSANGHLRLWNTRTGEQLKDEFSGSFKGALSADGNRLLGYHGKYLEIWDVPGLKLLHPQEVMPGKIYDIAFSPKGDLAFIYGASSYLWDVSRWQAIQEFKLMGTGTSVGKLGQSISVDRGISRPAAFSPDGKHAVFTKHQDEKRFLALWDIEARKEIRQFGDDDLWPQEISFTADGNVVCRSKEGRLLCWATNGKELWAKTSKDLQHINFFVFSKDGRFGLSNSGGLIIWGEDKPGFMEVPSSFSTRIWDLGKGTHLRALDPPKLPEGK